jgi:hypothetical protein
MWSRREPGELCEELSSCLSYQGIPEWVTPKAGADRPVDFFSETARVSRMSFFDYLKRMTHA